jgi:hypothetical protein
MSVCLHGFQMRDAESNGAGPFLYMRFACARLAYQISDLFGYFRVP